MRKILVVDNDEGLKFFLTEALMRTYDVTAVTSGEAALRLLEEEGREFDLVLSDVQTPGISGLELMRIVRANGLGGKHVKLAVMSDTSITESCRELGLLATFEKPFVQSPETLVARMLEVSSIARLMSCRSADDIQGHL